MGMGMYLGGDWGQIQNMRDGWGWGEKSSRCSSLEQIDAE